MSSSPTTASSITTPNIVASMATAAAAPTTTTSTSSDDVVDLFVDDNLLDLDDDDFTTDDVSHLFNRHSHNIRMDCGGGGGSESFSGNSESAPGSAEDDRDSKETFHQQRHSQEQQQTVQKLETGNNATTNAAVAGAAAPAVSGGSGDIAQYWKYWNEEYQNKRLFVEVLVGGLRYWTTSESLMKVMKIAGQNKTDAEIQGWWENSRNGQSLGVVIVRLSSSIHVRQFMRNLQLMQVDGVYPQVYPHTANHVEMFMNRYCTKDVPRPLAVYKDKHASLSNASKVAPTTDLLRDPPAAPAPPTQLAKEAPPTQLAKEAPPPPPSIWNTGGLYTPTNSYKHNWNWAPPVRGFRGRPDNSYIGKWRRTFQSPDPHYWRGTPGASSYSSSWHPRGKSYQWGAIPSFGSIGSAPRYPGPGPGSTSGITGGPRISMPSPTMPPPLMPTPLILSQLSPPLPMPKEVFRMAPPLNLSSKTQPSPPGVSSEDMTQGSPLSDRSSCGSVSPSAWEKFQAKERAMKRMEEMVHVAVKAAREEASSGNYADAIQTLTTARSTARYSTVYDDCSSLLKRLDVALKRIEDEAYKSKRHSRTDKDREEGSENRSRRDRSKTPTSRRSERTRDHSSSRHSERTNHHSSRHSERAAHHSPRHSERTDHHSFSRHSDRPYHNSSSRHSDRPDQHSSSRDSDRPDQHSSTRHSDRPDHHSSSRHSDRPDHHSSSRHSGRPGHSSHRHSSINDHDYQDQTSSGSGSHSRSQESRSRKRH